MTNLTEQLVNIAQDLQDGGNKLKALVDPILKSKNIQNYRQVFDYIADRRVAPVIATPSVDMCIAFIKNMSSNEDKVAYYYPLMLYINQIDSLYQKYKEVRTEFIKVCEETDHYYELANYYAKEPFSVDPDDANIEWKELEHNIFIGEAFLKAHDVRSAQTKLTESTSHIFRKSTPQTILEKFDNFRAHHSLSRNDFGSAADTYYLLSTYVPEKNRIEYLRLSMVYTVLSETGPKQKRQISTLINDERTAQVEIYALLDRLSKKSLVTLEELPQFVQVMKGVPGFSQDLLKKSVQQHNMFCISGLFDTISFKRLAQIIGTTVEDAIETMKNLILNSSVHALIDQPNQMIIYKPTQTEQERKDDSILAYCKALQHFTSLLPA